MKKLAFVLAILTLTAALGCSSGKDKEKPKPQTVSPGNPADRDTARNKAEKYDFIQKSRGAKEGMDLYLVREALQKYRVRNGAYPPGLSDINDYLSVDIDLDKYSYDPESGRIEPKGSP